MATLKLEGATSRTSGISAASLNAGANILGSEIDNTSNLDLYLDLELTWTCSTASTENFVVECYILYTINGTDYEDGGTSVDPKKNPITFFVDNGGTGGQRRATVNIPLSPYKYKILLKSELDQNATSVTLLAYGHNNQVV